MSTWMKHGCPEKMAIHRRSIAEKITLIDGLPVTLSTENNPVLMPISKAQNRELRVGQPVTLTCIWEACKTEVSSKDS